MNGISKIEKWLNVNGYYITSCKYEMYRHSDNFHRGELYVLDIYRTSNGYYIKVKTKGKPRYYLCEKYDGLQYNIKRLAFSQGDFIRSTKDLFPTLEVK